MKLNAKVTGITRESDRGVVFSGDVEGGGWLFKLPNTECYTLDQEFTLLVLTKDNADLLYRSLTAITGAQDWKAVKALCDQLRPDEPPPFMEQTHRCPDGSGIMYDAQPTEPAGGEGYIADA